MAAGAIIANPPSSGKVLTHGTILQLAGVQEPPDGSTHADYKAHGLWLVQFMGTLKWLLLNNLSRLLDNVYGHGYRLLQPGEVTNVVEQKAYKHIAKQFTKMGRTLRAVDHNKLTSAEQQQNTDAQVHAAGLQSMVRREVTRRRKAANWRQTTSGALAAAATP